MSASERSLCYYFVTERDMKSVREMFAEDAMINIM